MNEDERKFWHYFMLWICAAMIILGLASIGLDRPNREPIRITKEEVPVFLELNPIETITTLGADAHMTAFRVDPPEPTPPTAAEICNGLTYDYEEMGNPMICFRVVAAEQGVTPDRVGLAEKWIFNLIAGESGGCPLLIGGDNDIPVGCVPRVKGHGTDTGFGQATDSYWGRRGKLCTIVGVCAPWQILQSPYHSMLYSVVLPSMWDGRYAWCDYIDPKTGKKPTWHNCSLVSYDWRL